MSITDTHPALTRRIPGLLLEAFLGPTQPLNGNREMGTKEVSVVLLCNGIVGAREWRLRRMVCMGNKKKKKKHRGIQLSGQELDQTQVLPLLKLEIVWGDSYEQI
ncbi:hypothetical protein BHE74_00059468 [Ensete ventricosum]|nr:hypothetical protein BHE74_00059468 [Ensete ventricosum]